MRPALTLLVMTVLVLAPIGSAEVQVPAGSTDAEILAPSEGSSAKVPKPQTVDGIGVNPAELIDSLPLPSLCDVEALAEEEYGSNVTVEPAGNPWWDAAFDRYALYRVAEPSRFPIPEHSFAVDERRCEGADATRNFPTIQRRDGQAPKSVSEDEAKTTAFAFATTVNPEFLPDRRVVTSEDRAWLGHSVDDPRTQSLVDGWTVYFTTWSPRGGLLAHWYVEIAHDGVLEATVYTDELDVGPSLPDWEGANLRPDMVLEYSYHLDPRARYEFEAWRDTGDSNQNLRSPSETRELDYQPVASAGTFDGTRVQVTHPNASEAPTPVAESLAAGLAAAYNDTVHQSEASCAGAANPGSDWGLTATDPDCTLEVRLVDDRSLLCIACVAEGEQALFYVSEDLGLFLDQQGLYLGTDVTETLAKSLLGHLYLHRVQDRVAGWDEGIQSVLEGQALAAQSHLAPAEEADPTSAFLAITGNGPNGFQAHPEAALCANPGATGLFLGHLAAVEGVETVRGTLEGLATHRQGSCADRTARAIGGALGADETPVQSVAEARLDFARSDLLGDLQWGTPSGDDVQNWSSLLDPLALRDGFAGVDTYDGPLAVVPVDVSGASSAETDCWPDDEAYGIQLVETDDGATTTTEIACGGETTVAASSDRAVVLAVRNGTSFGSLEVQAS